MGMIDALAADGPAEGHGDRLRLFGRFVGSWELDRTAYSPVGEVVSIHRGEWHFGWVLGGRAIQDVWICPARGLPAPALVAGAEVDWPGEWGTVVRFPDPGLDAWRVTWHGPRTGAVTSFVARAVGDEIVQTATDAPVRWVFSEIEPPDAPTRFRWRADVSDDDGATWRTEIEMRVHRTT
ncbi:hypothetical protein WEI85_20900 [Actinomycetes bacterium KLBMP 9797]